MITREYKDNSSRYTKRKSIAFQTKMNAENADFFTQGS